MEPRLKKAVRAYTAVMTSRGRASFRSMGWSVPAKENRLGPSRTIFLVTGGRVACQYQAKQYSRAAAVSNIANGAHRGGTSRRIMGGPRRIPLPYCSAFRPACPEKSKKPPARHARNEIEGRALRAKKERNGLTDWLPLAPWEESDSGRWPRWRLPRWGRNRTRY